VAEAQDRLQRNLGHRLRTCREGARNIELASATVDQVLEGVADDQLRIMKPTTTGHQSPCRHAAAVRDIWIVGADRTPLVSGRCSDPRQLDLSTATISASIAMVR